MIKFYKEAATDNWVCGVKRKIAAGTCTMETNADNSYVEIKENGVDKTIADGPVSSFVNESGVAYASFAALDAATKDFFVKASTGGGGTTAEVADAIVRVNTLTVDGGQLTGFLNPIDVNVSYNGLTRKVTLTGDTRAFHYGIPMSTKVPVFTSGWTSAEHDLADNGYFLYYNGADFVWSTVAWDFKQLMIAFVYRDGVNFCLRECHGLQDWQSHQANHDNNGTYLKSGADVSGFTANSVTSTDRRPDVSETLVYDEDLPTLLPALISKQYTRLSLDGANNATITTDNADILEYTNGNRFQYNLFTGGVWTKATAVNNAYGKIFLMAVPTTSDEECQKSRFIWIMPQQVSTDRTTIENITPSNLNLGQISTALAEYVFVQEFLVRATATSWSIISNNKLTGNKKFQGVSSGNFLSSVSTDSSIRGIGTSSNPLTVAPISITYTALKALADTSTLVVGQRYIINDYQTIHEQPNTGEVTWNADNYEYIYQPNVIYTAPVEQLLVEALSTSKLANECKSLEFPQDIIYYNINNDQSVVPGCSKGYIYRRIDTELNNDIDMDFRKAKIRAYLDDGSYRACYWVMDPLGYNDGSLYFGYGFKLDFTNQTVTYTAVDINSVNKIDTIIFKDATDYKSQNITNNKFYGSNNYLIGNRNSLFIGDNFHNNTIGTGFYNNNIGTSFNNNTIGTSFHNNTIRGYFYYNTIGNSFSSNTIGYGFNSNTIGDSFYNNTIIDQFRDNTIGNNFNYNTIGNYFNYNTIGNDFKYNTIGDNLNYNTIGNDFYYNTIGNSFSSNTIGNNFNSNTIGNYFNSNTIGDSSGSNTIGNDFRKNNIESNVGSINFVSPLSVYVYLDYQKYIFNTSTGTTKLRYYDGDGSLQITDANA